MPALDAYLLRQELMDETQTGFWTNLMQAYWNSCTGNQVSDHGHEWGPDGRHQPVLGRAAPNPTMVEMHPDVSSYLRTFAKDLRFAHNYWVSKEMCALVTAAAESLPDDEQVKPEDFPTEGGWLVIPNGIVQADIRGNATVTSAILWRVVGGGVRVTYLADKHHPLDRLSTYAGIRTSADENGMSGVEAKAWADETWSRVPRLTPWHDDRADFHQPIPSRLTMTQLIPPEVADQISVTEGPNGAMHMYWPVGYAPDELGKLGHVESVPDRVLRWLIACLRIMQQPLASVTSQGVPAGARKRFDKSRVKVRNSAVTVIEYRRRAPGLPEPSGREFTHRFLRRGHWRMQPYKDAEGEWDRKRIWIHPTIVGDEHLPLKLREHVNALQR